MREQEILGTLDQGYELLKRLLPYNSEILNQLRPEDISQIEFTKRGVNIAIKAPVHMINIKGAIADEQND